MNKKQIIEFTNSKGEIIGIEAIIPILKKKSGRYWFVYSPDLKTLGSSKKSLKDAAKDFEKSLDIFFTIQIKNGVLETTLKNFGWKKTNKTLEKPKHYIPFENISKSSAITLL